MLNSFVINHIGFLRIRPKSIHIDSDWFYVGELIINSTLSLIIKFPSSPNVLPGSHSAEQNG